jgi:hypothetical protein
VRVTAVAVILAAVMAAVSGCRLPGQSPPPQRTFRVDYRVHNAAAATNGALLDWDADLGNHQTDTLPQGTADWTTSVTIGFPPIVHIGASMIMLPPSNPANLTCEIDVDGVRVETKTGSSACTAFYDLRKVHGTPQPADT